MLISKLADAADMDDPKFNYWITNMKQLPKIVRKQWEMCYACQALHERGKLVEGNKGICFGTGLELLPSYFASLGCHITATDLPPTDPRCVPWRDTGQYAINVKNLNMYRFCEEQLFANRVTLEYVDMNNIPPHLLKGQYDFSWSLCSVDHCGSIELGKRFIINQMQCLKPKGVAVHTTEYNITSSEKLLGKVKNKRIRGKRTTGVGQRRRDTIDNAGTVMWLREDVEDLYNRAVALGYLVEPLQFAVKPHFFNTFVGKFPNPGPQHMRLQLGKYVGTSFGFILAKP